MIGAFLLLLSAISPTTASPSHEGGLSVSPEWLALKAHAGGTVQSHHLRDLLNDPERCEKMCILDDGPCGLILDWSRQKVTLETMRLLFALGRARDVEGKRERMRRGDAVNPSEDRGALHHTLRSSNVCDSAFEFADRVRRESHFKAVVVCGIGGSQLGPEFAVRSLEPSKEVLTTRFLSNVDPQAFNIATRGLDPLTTLIVASSKSFGTTETTENVRRCKRWLEQAGVDDVSRHFCACSTESARKKVEDLIGKCPLFELWDWVGGRFSATGTPGTLPLALAAGSQVARDFLRGARDMDTHFFSAPLEKNAPVILALLGVWNRNFLGLPCRAVVPYASRLARFPAHLQQLEMESNGKGVTIDTHQPIVGYDVGEIVLGEPGTDAQHSFFQFLHAASTTVPVDFVGFLKGEDKQGHNLLMANFFAQPDALALGTKLTATLPYKVFHGDRPSLTILFPQLTPYTVGALLAMYEHRTAVQGWLWNVNSFDQFGVELGKTLATDILGLLDGRHTTERRLNPSTSRLLEEYRTVNAAENTQAKS